jgi:hypothetical protein
VRDSLAATWCGEQAIENGDGGTGLHRRCGRHGGPVSHPPATNWRLDQICVGRAYCTLDHVPAAGVRVVKARAVRHAVSCAAMGKGVVVDRIQWLNRAGGCSRATARMRQSAGELVASA